MSTGIKIISTNGSLLIDDSHMNYAVDGPYTATAITDTYLDSGSGVSPHFMATHAYDVVTTRDVPPIPMLRLPYMNSGAWSGAGVLTVTKLSPFNYRIYIIADKCTPSLFILRPMSDMPLPQNGVAVFDSSGTLPVYHSGAPLMNAVLFRHNFQKVTVADGNGHLLRYYEHVDPPITSGDIYCSCQSYIETANLDAYSGNSWTSIGIWGLGVLGGILKLVRYPVTVLLHPIPLGGGRFAWIRTNVYSISDSFSISPVLYFNAAGTTVPLDLFFMRN